MKEGSSRDHWDLRAKYGQVHMIRCLDENNLEYTVYVQLKYSNHHEASSVLVHTSQ